MKCLFFLLIVFCCAHAYAQYAPQAGLAGSTAISAGSSAFVGWATQCSIQRGYMDIANPSLGLASAGDSTQAIGAPDGGVVSLGDSGIAVLTFSSPVFDGPGADFAVFENGFRNGADSAQAFLELAFVEVSSDGVHYFRFPATSLTQINTQLGNGDYINATQINNLAGKYVASFGTPFDLQDLADTPGLDINHITHVRLVDVTGAITGHASADHAGRPINDPYPTPFPSCGFDLDAVGVIHSVAAGVNVQPANGITISVYPNPVTDNLVVSVHGQFPEGLVATLMSVTGAVMEQIPMSGIKHTVPVTALPAGMYYLVLQDANANKWVEKIIKY